jgi:hypothetical protein
MLAVTAAAIVLSPLLALGAAAPSFLGATAQDCSVA